jgi:aspartyl-tRNA(Asn)/glutamyl-tRNA(Gln) amidotransferase subunit B
LSLKDFKVTPEKLVAIVQLVQEGKVNNSGAKIIFETVAQTGQEPVQVLQEKGLEQIDAVQEFERIAQKIIDANPDVVAQYKAGKDKLIGFFVGQVMKETESKGNPQTIQTIVKKLLAL